jgi:hypothetical protein
MRMGQTPQEATTPVSKASAVTPATRSFVPLPFPTLNPSNALDPIKPVNVRLTFAPENQANNAFLKPLAYTDQNYASLLQQLTSGGYSKKDITKLAGYSGANASRDYGNMLSSSVDAKNQKWNQLIAALMQSAQGKKFLKETCQYNVPL